MEKREKKGIYKLVILILIILAISAGVYALNAGERPNPGHLLSEIVPPAGCQQGQFIIWNGNSMVCGNVTMPNITAPNVTLTIEGITSLNGNIGIHTSNPLSAFEVTGDTNLNGQLYFPAPTTQARSIEIGKGRTGNGYSYIDFIGDATYTDYSLRILRGNTGADSASQILHRGTGDLMFLAQDAATLKFGTNSATRMVITSSGNVGIGTASPGFPLTVSGTTSVIGGIYSSGSNAGFVAQPRDGSGADFIWYNPTGDNMRLWASTDLLLVSTTGNAGISGTLRTGSTTPLAYNQFGTGAKDNAEITNADDVYISDDLEIDGTLYITGGYTSIKSGDIAENLLTERGRENTICEGKISEGGTGCIISMEKEIDYGDVVCIDSNSKFDQIIKKCDVANSPLVVGVVSNTSVINMGNNEKHSYPIGVAGVVWAKVSNENGEIKAGDLLVSSSRPGYAMKAPAYYRAGTVLGKAFAYCNKRNSECVIPIFIALQ